MAFWSLGKLRTKMLFWTIGCPMLFGLHDLNEDDFGSINWKGMYGYTIFYSRIDCSFKFFPSWGGKPESKRAVAWNPRLGQTLPYASATVSVPKEIPRATGCPIENYHIYFGSVQPPGL